MRISDLLAPVTSAKADWLVATTWIGFTPSANGSRAVAQCQATINRQMAGGYVLEYITKGIERPNPGHERDPEYLEDMKAHAPNAGRLVAVHRLRPSSRPLPEIIGKTEYEELQDRWDESGGRRRWSVAFPIVESWDIVAKPLAKDILGQAGYDRLIKHSSSTLRPLNEDEQASIAGLEISRRAAANAWIAIEDEMAMAERSPVPSDVQRNIDRDMASALEGMEEERKAKVRRRAAWLADLFARDRRRAGTLMCDACGYDPAIKYAGLPVKPRSLLDVHHMNPLEEGVRRTWFDDFALLCPTCHRVEHQLMKAPTPPGSGLLMPRISAAASAAAIPTTGPDTSQ